jgi:hypothetical protein
MRTEELKAIVDAWQNEDKDRAVIVIASERLEGSKTEGTIIMKGNKNNLLMALFNFMEQQVDMMEEATKIGILNKLLGRITESTTPEKSYKNLDTISKLLEEFEKFNTKHS